MRQRVSCAAVQADRMRRLCRSSLTLAVALIPVSTALAQYALQFHDGGAVRVEDPGLPATLEQLGIEFWVKASETVRTPVHLVSRWPESREASDQGTFFVGLRNSTRVTFGIRNEAGAIEIVTGGMRRRDGEWRHVAATWNGTTLALAVDGRVVAEKEVTEFGNLASSQLPLILGPVATQKSARASVFPGFLADVSLLRVPRNIVAIRAGGSAPPARSSPDLLAHYRLSAPSPTHTVMDSASGAEGRLTPRLARSGWCVTTTWSDPGPEHTALDLHCYDLHAAPDAVNLTASWRNTLVTNEKTRQIGVLWQGVREDTVHVTWLAADLTGHDTLRLESKHPGVLAAGTTDAAGNVYYLVIERAPRSRAENVVLAATLHKADATGKLLLSQPVDTSRAGFNIWSFNENRRGNMRFSNGALGLILPRTMFVGGDGLRHQGAIAVTFSAKTLGVTRMHGQTSGHSMGNVLTLSAKGEFLGVDLGDNYPRGVHLHRFTPGQRTSAVVFTFKTRHGTRSRNGSPVYTDISDDSKTFYKWSNDNAVYTELGGIAEDRKGYSVFFATARSLDGKVLDNSRAFRGCDDPRDLAMVHVVKRFAGAGRGGYVNDRLMVSLPKNNQVEEGGFFDFSGRWSKQRVTGVRWLTRYGRGEAAESPQVAGLRDKSTLVLWRKSGPEGRSLQALRIDARGKVNDPTQLNVDVELHRQDRLVRVDDRIFLLGAAADQRTRLYFVRDLSR